jgi:rhodanese-related sulfurtransferase
MVKEITVQELKQMMDNHENFQLIDCREPHEADISSIGGTLMPLNEIADHEEEISRDKKVIIHCRSGARSANAILYLQDMFDFDNLYNLKGGINAWAKEIDPSVATY